MTVLEHELFQCIANNASYCLSAGILVDWWNAGSIDEYQKRTHCVVDQYDNYTVDDGEILNLNGINTLGENIAYIGGYEEA